MPWPAGGGDVHLAIGDFHNWKEAMSFLGLPEIGNDSELVVDYGRHGRDLGAVIEKLGGIPWVIRCSARPFISCDTLCLYPLSGLF